MTQLSSADPQMENTDNTVPGMSMEAVHTLLTKRHNTSIPENDPLLMIVTILNAYLGEVQKLHARHEEGLARLMAEKTGEYMKGVNTAVDQLSTSLSSASVEGIRKIFDDHAAKLNAFKSAVYWGAAIVTVSALFNVAVFVLRSAK
ncbi:hypothetical protein FACS1894168_0130 [Deltaproteobacteria bacterium]|nr:hypothetical protein FACS1894168_0130 [Deltaproteobacteria bacterium]